MAAQPSGLANGSGDIRDNLSGHRRDSRGRHGAGQGRAIASHDRPFSGEICVKPDVLLQVRPE
jgi:hypothetical protein